MTAISGFTADQLEKRGAGHTAREIAQQPAVWRETGEIVSSRREEVGAFLRPLLERPDLRVVLTGAGTSAFAGEILAPALSRRLGRRVDALATTDIVSNPVEHFAEDRPTLLVSFARSGNSPESKAGEDFTRSLASRTPPSVRSTSIAPCTVASCSNVAKSPSGSVGGEPSASCASICSTDAGVPNRTNLPADAVATSPGTRPRRQSPIFRGGRRARATPTHCSPSSTPLSVT